MVENQKINPHECILVVKKYFECKIQNFKLIESGFYTGYWWIEYSNTESTKINFEGDIGGHFSIKIFIENTEYSLWQFDRSVNNRTKSTNENILYQLGTLKQFLTESR